MFGWPDTSGKFHSCSQFSPHVDTTLSVFHWSYKAGFVAPFRLKDVTGFVSLDLSFLCCHSCVGVIQLRKMI